MIDPNFAKRLADNQIDKITEYNKNGKPVAGRYSWKKGIDMEFTDAQFKRLDDIEEAAVKFLSALAETDDWVWDLEDIWELIYTGADRLTKRGRRVRIPTHVTTPDGKEFITDWYGEEEHA